MKFLKPLPLFSHPLGFYDLDVDPKKILKKIKKTPFQPFAKPHEERTYGHKTVATKNYQLLKKFPDLQNEINKAIVYHIKEILRFKIDFHIFSSWGTKTTPQGFSLSHCHSNSWLSGCYYMQSHPSFEIEFRSPLSPSWHMPFLPGPTYLNIHSAATWIVPTIPGRLLIFPSLLRHAILRNDSNIDRYSIAFNLIPKGTLGEKDGLLILKP